MPNRGRPPLLTDEVILDAALAAFASAGYEAMSVRALNAQLGLSHETISKRFGPKVDLFRAALGHGVGCFISDLDVEIRDEASADDLDRLRRTLRALMVAMSRHPALGALLHREELSSSERALIIEGSGLGERLSDFIELLRRLQSAGVIRETHLRDLWFLLQGAVAPVHFPELATLFDPIDGPVEPEALIDRMTEAILRSMVSSSRA